MSDLVQQSEFMSRLQQLSEPTEQEGLQPDAELLALYVDGGNREAIERLIRRYAPMVANVCRLTISDDASAEDAFQATFLILLKSAGKIRKQSSVAAWLHGVAYRTASRMRRKKRECAINAGHEDVIKQCAVVDDPIAGLARRMELEALDRELEKLPERLRGPLIEHYLLGFSAPQIAERMELSTSAVEGRLRRGRRQLRTRLAKRGISLSVLIAGSGLFQKHLAAADAVNWTANFMHHHLPDVPGAGNSGDGINTFSSNTQVSSLVNGELSMISTATLKAGLAAGILLIAGAFAVLAADQDEIGAGSSSPANSQVLTMAKANQEPLVLAQFGGGQTQVVNSNSGQTAPAELEMTATKPANGATGRDAGENLTSAAMPAEEQTISWQQPEISASQQPVWLSGGAASMRAMERHREVLSQEIEFDLAAIPLRSVAAWLTDETGLQFEVVINELDLLGVDPDEPVSITGRGSVKELLRRILSPLELTYRVTESCVEITSIDAAEADPAIRFYDLSYVLPNTSHAEALINAIQQSAEPDSWLAAGGTNSIVLVGSTMIVAAHEAAHQKIELILLNLTKMNRRNVEQAPPKQNAPMMGGGMGGMGGGMGGGGGGMF